MRVRKSICILAFSPVARDGRVLRQIEYLVPLFDLTVIGYGPAHPAWVNRPHIRWVSLPEPPPIGDIAKAWRARDLGRLRTVLGSAARRGAFRLSLYPGKLWPAIYSFGYRLRWIFMPELNRALAQRYDAYHANDWDTLLLAAQAAKRDGARLVVDLHEYAPLEYENRPNWWLREPMLRYMLRTYATQADAVTTVAPLIAQRYEQEFDFAPMVVLNAPPKIALPPKTLNPQNIRLIHHGIASPVRRPELMLKALALCEPRYTLHFMFVHSDYVEELKALAERLTPGRVFFHDPVPPEKIVERIAAFDVGFNVIAPTNYNYAYALPNKFFESIVAGLAVYIGPSAQMQRYVERYGFGCTAPSFAPRDLAATLNRVTADEWVRMQQAARQAAQELHAAAEMAKVVQLYRRLFEER